MQSVILICCFPHSFNLLLAYTHYTSYQPINPLLCTIILLGHFPWLMRLFNKYLFPYTEMGKALNYVSKVALDLIKTRRQEGHTEKVCYLYNIITHTIMHQHACNQNIAIIAITPSPLTVFSMLHTENIFQCATLKSWKWAWGRGYLLIQLWPPPQVHQQLFNVAHWSYVRLKSSVHVGGSN